MSNKIDTYKEWEKSGNILINEDITVELATKVILSLRNQVSDNNIKSVSMYINSSGGDTAAMQMIIAQMERVAKIKPIYTHIGSYAYSAAALIALVGTIRTSDRFTRILYHEVKSSNDYSTQHDIGQTHKQIIDLNKFGKELIVKNTKLKKAEVDKYFDSKDIFISAKQALKYNIIHHIL